MANPDAASKRLAKLEDTILTPLEEWSRDQTEDLEEAAHACAALLRAARLKPPPAFDDPVWEKAEKGALCLVNASSPVATKAGHFTLDTLSDLTGAEMSTVRLLPTLWTPGTLRDLEDPAEAAARAAAAAQIKALGNEAYKAGDFDLAIEKWREAIVTLHPDLDGHVPCSGEAEFETAMVRPLDSRHLPFRDAAVLAGNIAMAHVKKVEAAGGVPESGVGGGISGIKMANTCAFLSLRLDPTYEKAYNRVISGMKLAGSAGDAARENFENYVSELKQMRALMGKADVNMGDNPLLVKKLTSGALERKFPWRIMVYRLAIINAHELRLWEDNDAVLRWAELEEAAALLHGSGGGEEEEESSRQVVVPSSSSQPPDPTKAMLEEMGKTWEEMGKTTDLQQKGAGTPRERGPPSLQVQCARACIRGSMDHTAEEKGRLFSLLADMDIKPFGTKGELSVTASLNSADTDDSVDGGPRGQWISINLRTVHSANSMHRSFKVDNFWLRRCDTAGGEQLFGPDDHRMSFGTPKAVDRAEKYIVEFVREAVMKGFKITKIIVGQGLLDIATRTPTVHSPDGSKIAVEEDYLWRQKKRAADPPRLPIGH